MEIDISAGVKSGNAFHVCQKDTAMVIGSGALDVLSTPIMIAWMEKTCMESVQEYLPEAYDTVGVSVNISHDRATPVGEAVECVSELIEVDGRRLTFIVSASDRNGVIGKGVHTRFIINKEKFMDKFLK